MGYLLADFSVLLCVLSCITPALCEEDRMLTASIYEKGIDLKVVVDGNPAEIAKGSANADCLELKMENIELPELHKLPRFKIDPEETIIRESTKLYTCMVSEEFEVFHLLKRVYRVEAMVKTVTFPNKGIEVSAQKGIQNVYAYAVGCSKKNIPVITEKKYFKSNNFDNIFYFNGEVRIIE